MQDLLDMNWHSQPTFAAYLEECAFDFQAVSSTGERIGGKCRSDFVLGLPDTLTNVAKSLRCFRKELQNQLNVRKVGRSYYLAEFVTYIEALTKRSVAWDALAEILSAARPESLKEKHLEGRDLQKNLLNFTVRNPEHYRKIRADVRAYVAHCERLPKEKRPTLMRWTRDRRTATKKSK
jgi:hypothetical protein